MKSIVFPAISTGFFGFAKDRCATILLSTIIVYVEGPTVLTQIVFYLYDQKSHEIFEHVLASRTQKRLPIK